MTRSKIITTAAVAVTALTVLPGAGVSARSKKVTKITTTIEQYAQGAPNPSGIQFGLVRSSAPLGKGLQYSSYTVTPPSATSPATVTGRFKNAYDLGTTHGTFALTFPAPGANVTYTGTITFTGGSGRFRNIKGGGTIVCTTSDGGAHKLCTVHAKATGI